MKYLINFQVLVTFVDGSNYSLRSTYTTLEKECEDNNLKSFKDVGNWFYDFFKNNSLDNFVNIAKFNKKISKADLKVGRITNSLSGEYETF